MNPRDRRNWGDRSTMPVWGILETAEDEMSVYFSQHYRFDSAHLRRGVLRVDGFASAHAGYGGGELITRPVRFTGRKLLLNYATSANGSVRVEIRNRFGKPLPGFTLQDSTELYGNAVAETYRWAGGNDVTSFEGEPVQLRFVLKDCDLYSYRFA